MLNKKGAIEIQFNWIFVLIAGVIILGFFITIINKQKDLAEAQVSASIKINLGAIFTGARAATETASRINIPNIDIIYDCDGYIVGKADAIRSKSSFSPNKIKGPVILSWTKDWNMPYRVTNFLYVTSPFIRYIFVRDSDGIADSVYHMFPNRTIIDQGEVKAFFTKEIVDESEIPNLKDQNHYKVRFIFFGIASSPESVSLPKLGGIKRKDYTAVKINMNSLSDLQRAGEIIFYEKSGDSFRSIDSSVYIGEASIFGAVLVDDIDTYNCNMQRAFNNLQIVNSIYWNREKDLKSYYQSDPLGDPNGCQNPYTEAESFFQTIDQSSRGFTPSFASAIRIASDRIQTINEQALQRSCPSIY